MAALEQKPADFPAFLRLMEESGFQVKHGRGGAISFLAPGQDKYTRLRASTLGPGFDPDDIRAAKAAMSELLGGAKLPKMDTLKKQHRELSEKKKALYAEYRKAQADMRQAVAVKANIDHLLSHADEQKNKAQER